MSFLAGNSPGSSSRPILLIGEPALREPARAVAPEEINSERVQRVIDDLIETMRAAKGAGLAATQIGEPLAICVIEVDHNPRYPYKPQIPLTVLINPVWTPMSDEQFMNNEGCLSVPGMRGDVARFTQIRLGAFDRAGTYREDTVQGLSAGTYQHECDHLDGVLFIDRVTDPTSLCTWESFDRYGPRGVPRPRR